MAWRTAKIRHASQIVPSLEEFTPAPEDIDDDYVPTLRGVTYGPIWLRTYSYLSGPKDRLPAFSTMELRVSRVDEFNIGTLAIRGTELHFLLVPTEACAYDLATEVAAVGILQYLQGYDEEESGAIGGMVALANAHEMRTLEEIDRIRTEFERSPLDEQESARKQ